MTQASLSCRFCAEPLRLEFADLGMQPLSNRLLRPDQLLEMEPFYPLQALVCENCWLVQAPDVQTPDNIFGDYLYFSSFSESWLDHARRYVAGITGRLGLDQSSSVVEMASNDGYLLQFFKKAGIPALGVEPAANVAKHAMQAGIETEIAFFGTETARRLAGSGRTADLLIGNNVLAHVPDLNDFVAGMKVLLKPSGTITMEFPHLLRLIEGVQYDTIYHEHFSYFSLMAVRTVFQRHGLTIYDVEELPTHGGSLRIYARHREWDGEPVRPAIEELAARETAAGLDQPAAYAAFAERVRESKRALLAMLIDLRRAGKQVVAYGAAAKGNTLLNYCGVRTDFVEYAVDKSPHKQGLFTPGTHIPIQAPERIFETRPDYLLILPWNLRDEIISQMAGVREWGGKFIIPIPNAEVVA